MKPIILFWFVLVAPVLLVHRATAQAIPPDTISHDLPIAFETNTNNQIRWTTYYVSTNKFAPYLQKDFTFETHVSLADNVQDKIQDFFKSTFTNIYNVLGLTSEDEDAIYDIIDHVYHRQLLFNTYQEYMEMLTELEKMGSHILIREVAFRRITVKQFENNRLLVEAVWTVDALLHHVTHNHEQQNANCVQFIIEVSDDDELKIKAENIVSIDRFNIYQ